MAVRLGEGKDHGNEWKNRPDQRADQRGSGLADNTSLKREGKLDQVVGKVKEKTEEAVDKIKNVLINNRLKRQAK